MHEPRHASGMSNRSRAKRQRNAVAQRSSQPTGRNSAGRQEQMISVTEVTEIMEQWSAPLEADDFARYENVVPGSAERILRMAEAHALHLAAMESQQSDHRQELEHAVITGNERRANIGQWTATGIAVFAGGRLHRGPGRCPQRGSAAVVGSVFALGAIVWFAGGRPPRRRKDEDDE